VLRTVFDRDRRQWQYTMPERIRIERGVNGWTAQGARYCTHRTKFGNPFYAKRGDDRATAVAQYEAWIGGADPRHDHTQRLVLPPAHRRGHSRTAGQKPGAASGSGCSCARVVPRNFAVLPVMALRGC
jgi:hypothetical protein